MLWLISSDHNYYGLLRSAKLLSTSAPYLVVHDHLHIGFQSVQFFFLYVNRRNLWAHLCGVAAYIGGSWLSFRSFVLPLPTYHTKLVQTCTFPFTIFFWFWHSGHSSLLPKASPTFPQLARRIFCSDAPQKWRGLAWALVWLWLCLFDLDLWLQGLSGGFVDEGR